MRILAFSDLAWGAEERGSSGERRVGGDSFLRIAAAINPGIIVFAGDAAYDRCSRRKTDETEQFLGLLRQLASAERHCIIVEGNNDDSFGTYGRVRDAADENPYLHEVSSKALTVGGIRFLGVPTGTERKMAESSPDATDIAVAHAPYANRPWLFDLPASCIVTGHYGMLIGEIAEKAYIALDCSPFSYAVIDWQEGWQKIGYVAISTGGTCRIELDRGKSMAGTGCDAAFFRRLTEGRGELPYRDEIEALRRAKSTMAAPDRADVIGRLLAMGIRKTHIERYLGRSAR